MEQLFLAYGPTGLFLVSFLAATLLPLGSEWLLAALLLQRLDPVLLVTVATLGNMMGACTTYLIGRAGSEPLKRRLLRMDSAAEDRAVALFRRYGSPALLFSWLPLVGDGLCLAAGLFHLSFCRFAILMTIGKLGRYLAVAMATLHIQSP
jgi:membrane protein YqaA with SNARE-associated domain